MKKTQTTKVLGHMLLMGPITQKDAIERYGCYRLAARISDIEKLGIPISRRNVKVPTQDGKTTVTEYFLEPDQYIHCIKLMAASEVSA